MHYSLICQCGNSLVISRSQAGQSVKCTACGQDVVVPTLRNLAELPVAEPPPASGATKRSRVDEAQSTWRGWRGTAIAVALSVFFIAGLGAAWSLYQSNLAKTDYTVEDEIVAGDELFDQMTAEELSVAWSDFQQLQLTYKEPPVFYRMTQFSRSQQTNALIRGSVALIGFGLALLIWFTAPKKRSPPANAPAR